MNSEDTSRLEGQHAFLSPSQPAWLRYSDSHLIDMYRQESAKQKGTRLHAWAEETIKLGITQPLKTENSLYNFVNDAIGYNMESEKLLYHTDYCFGTSDAIKFDGTVLRVYDLKTGVTKPHPDQLKVYAALWCMINKVDPKKIIIDMRFYQINDVIQVPFDPDEIRKIISIIKHHESILKKEDTGL